MEGSRPPATSAAPSGRGVARRVALRALISGAIIVSLLYWLPLERLLGAIGTVSLATWSFVFTGFLLGHLAAAMKWRMILGVVDVSLGRTQAIRAHGAGLFANLCLPSIVGGDIVRAALAAREAGKLESIAVASLTDRLCDTLVLVLLAAAAAVAIPVVDIGPLRIGPILLVLGASLLACAGGAVAVCRMSPHRLPKRLVPMTGKVRDALELLRASPTSAVLLLGWSLSIQSWFIVLNIVLARSVGLSLEWSLWFFAWPLAKLVGLLPVSLGGIGVRDAALLVLLAPYGADAATTLAQSLSWQAVLIAAGLLCGAAVSMSGGFPRPRAASSPDHQGDNES